MITVRGAKIEVEHIGRSGGPTLVFLHEGLGSLDLWRDFPRRVSEATGLPAFVYSRAGYGKSNPAPLPRPVRYMHDEAALLPDLLKAAGIDDPVLVGHSDGASISIIHAGSGGKARALVLEAPHVFTEEMGLRSIAKAREAYESGDLRTRLAKYHQNVDAAFWGWNRPWLDPEFRKWNLEEFLPRIPVPILVVQGEDDEYGTRKQVDAIQRGARQVEVLMLPRCGHSPHRDQPGYPARDGGVRAEIRYAGSVRSLPTCRCGTGPRATTTAAASINRSRATVHHEAGSSPPKQPQRKSMPRSSAWERKAMNATSRQAMTAAAARSITPATSAIPPSNSIPTTADATNGTKAAGTMR